MAAPLENAPRGISTTTPVRTGSSKSFLDIAIQRNYCTTEQIVWALAEFQKLGESNEQLSSFLIHNKILSADQIKECERWLRAPKAIGGFELIEKVGQGGMGSVFRARQVSMDRDIALKILPPSLAQDPSFKERFLHEARLSAKFNHLNIISGIDCGEDKGLTFFAMEFVDGTTLKQILKEKGKLDAPEAADVVLQIAGALVYAEGHGLVHRDIKPDNIMLNSANVAKLCDLGLAKLTTPQGDSFQTQAGMTVGTPHYISPEQTRGDPNVDTRSDIYSLGATFYHLLTGTTPFNAPTSASVMALHLTETAPNPCDIDHVIPIAYGQILAKMMAKDCNDRYRHAQDLVNDLELVKAHNAPSAASFHAKSSCALPVRMSKSMTTGPRAPVLLERRMPIPRLRPGSIVSWLAAAALFAGAAFAVWKYMIDAPTPSTVAATEHPKKEEAPAEPVKPADVPTSSLLSPDKMESDLASKPVKLEPEPQAKAPTPPPKNPETKAVATKKEPAMPKEAVRPAIVAKPIKPRPTDPAPAKAEMTPDIVFARFLKEMSTLNTKDLAKLRIELGDLAARPQYKLAKAYCDETVKEVDAAMLYETNALKAIAAAGGMVDLNEDAAKKFGVKQGKISGFDAARGIAVSVGPVTISLNAGSLPMGDILKSSPDGTALAQVRYRAIKGDLDGARSLAKALKGADLEKWDRRLRLQDPSAEFELLAAEEYKVLQQEHDKQHWQNVLKLVPEFEKAFGATEAFKLNAATLAEWKADATRSLAPLEGLESTGKWEPLTLPAFNACKVAAQTEAAFSTKFIRVTGGGANGLAKAAAVRAGTLDLQNAEDLRFNLRNMSTEPVKVAVIFTQEGRIFESPTVDMPPASHQEVTLWVKNEEYKQVLGADPRYDKPLPPDFKAEKLMLVFYTPSGFSVDVDGVVLK